MLMVIFQVKCFGGCMNFEYYKKVLLLPLKSTEKGVLRTLAYHCNPDQDNLCIPSWDTLVNESGVARGIIKKILTTSQDAGIISYQSRGDVGTGKKPNEYFFLFDDIKFYGRGSQIKLSKENRLGFKLRMEQARANFKSDELEKDKKSSSFNLSKSSALNQSNSISTSTHQNSQKFSTELSNAEGLAGGTISTPSEPISICTDTVSKEEIVCKNKEHTCRDTTTEHCNKKKTALQGKSINQDSNIDTLKGKNQKTVLHEKECNPVLNIEHDSQFNTVAKKKPSEQSNDEWLKDHEGLQLTGIGKE